MIHELPELCLYYQEVKERRKEEDREMKGKAGISKGS
jgi:hypothetical protein